MTGSFTGKFSGLDRLYGDGSIEQLARSKVMVIGIGGVGSWSAEALALSGVGTIILVDLDDICESNTNRQIHTLVESIGQPKTKVMGQRLKAINPESQVEVVDDFYTKNTPDDILSLKPDMIIDAIDSLHSKAYLLSQCRLRHQPIITVGGAGGRRDPTQIEVSDLSQTIADPLLRNLRKNLRQVYDFPRTGDFGVTAVYSRERMFYASEDGSVSQDPYRQKRGSMDCQTGLGTASFVTGTYGFTASQLAVESILKRRDSLCT